MWGEIGCPASLALAVLGLDDDQSTCPVTAGAATFDAGIMG
jgi:hypothetical protein